MQPTKEVVDELKSFKNWILDMITEYERTGKKYFYPDPDSIIGELDSRIDSYSSQLYLNEK